MKIKSFSNFVNESEMSRTSPVHKSGFIIPNLSGGDTIRKSGVEWKIIFVGKDYFIADNGRGTKEFSSLEGFTPVSVKSLNEQLIIEGLTWRLVNDDYVAKNKKTTYRIYKSSSGYILNVNGKNTAKGTLHVCKAAAEDHKKSLLEQLVNESMTKYATMVKNKAKMAQDTLNGLGIENSIIPSATKGPSDVFNGDKQLYDIMINADVLGKESERIKNALEYLEEDDETNEELVSELFQTSSVEIDSDIESIADEIKRNCDRRMHIDFVYEVMRAASKIERPKVIKMLEFLKNS